MRTRSIAPALVLAAACGHATVEKPTGPCIGAAEKVLVRVGSCNLGETTWRYQMAIAPGDRRGDAHLALSALIQREVLAEGALAAGDPPPTAQDVEKRVEAGELIVWGTPQPRAAVPWLDEHGTFHADALDKYVASLGVGKDEFLAEQGREQLADRMVNRIAPTDDPGDILGVWIKQHCDDLYAKGEIKWDAQLSPGYEPCH